MSAFTTFFKDLISPKPAASPSLTSDSVLISGSTSIGDIVLDASLSESHTSEAEFPEHPVEFGASINDHRIVKPQKINITGVVSNYPLKSGGGSGGGSTRSQSTWEALRNLQINGDVFSVTSVLTTYSNMQIRSLLTTQDVNSATILNFTASLQELIIVETETATIPASALEQGKTAEQASGTKNLGTKQATTPSQNILDIAASSVEQSVGEIQ
jgi:hypothetical protein